MEVLITGGFLDGIRETVHVTTKKNKDSYADTKAKMEAEDAEDKVEREDTARTGFLGRLKNSERIKAYRERMSELFGQGVDWVKG